ncbi:conditioned medium-induced protein 4 [Halegenticoccus tardaugens]|uniref:conditioned medium-induced protein 4 n=1 Tax=Halegenticoccus tardaugens TaxID=2071624 RepID=UPI00100BC8B0|nr:conditioned medium-induced protein 4 [Halegenticoccus tardaugens]
MDEKTAELRDIFIDATGSETVTESQEEARGSLTDDEEGANERVAQIIATMRERYTFDSSLDDDGLRRVVRGFFDDESDATLADELGVDESEVFDARMDLHLVREEDRDAPFELDELRPMVVENDPLEARAEALGADETVVARYSEVAEADIESTRANDRFRDEFEELLTDSDLSTQLATNAREDGLKDATEDIETDVSF